MVYKHKNIINCQRQNAPVLITDKRFFKEIKQKIIYEILNFLVHKCISAKKLVEKLTALYQPLSNIKYNICKKECMLLI